MRDEPRSGCPINAGVEMLGDPWSLIVLRDVMFGDRRYFRELLTNSEEGIASNILASRLKSLVGAGLLTREDAARGHKARYSLTEAGIQTLPVLVALGTWGRSHCQTSRELTVRQELLEQGGPQMVADLQDELRAHHLGVRTAERPGPSPTECLHAAYQTAIAGNPL